MRCYVNYGLLFLHYTWQDLQIENTFMCTITRGKISYLVLGSICSIGAIQTMLGDYKYSVKSRMITPYSLLTALPGVCVCACACEKDDYLHTDISKHLKRGIQNDAHEFFLTLILSITAKLDLQ